MYLYQRYIEEAIERNSPLKSRDTISAPEYELETANLIKRVQKESSNLDIEFTDIDEGNTTEEAQSPLIAEHKRRHTMNVGGDF